MAVPDYTSQGREWSRKKIIRKKKKVFINPRKVLLPSNGRRRKRGTGRKRRGEREEVQKNAIKDLNQLGRIKWPDVERTSPMKEKSKDE